MDGAALVAVAALGRYYTWTMKLINPTDDDLDVAFAEKVAGCSMLDREPDMTADPKPTCVKYDGKWLWVEWDKPLADDPKYWVGELRPLNFTRSADAVLPWLERSPFDVQITFSNTCDSWMVRLQSRFTGGKEFVHTGDSCEPMARAAVIAMLRAHGVDVEFTG